MRRGGASRLVLWPLTQYTTQRYLNITTETGTLRSFSETVSAD